MSIELVLYIGFVFHFIGDYIIQSDWMANEKTKKSFPAICHALSYSVLFLYIVDITGFLIIAITHYFIDRFRLARYVCWFKNLLSPKMYRFKWKECDKTGYHNTDRPAWLSVWLLIIADNIIHIVINSVSIWWFHK